MAGFSSLGGNSFGTVGGISGQQGSYGIQPPTAAYAPSAATLGGGLARSAPSNPAGFYQSQAASGLPADTSSQHQENVAMAQAGLGAMGFNSNTPGTSYSGYGWNPNIYADINAYMTNPLGTAMSPMGSAGSDPYSQGAQTNTQTYKNFTDQLGQQLTWNYNPQRQANQAMPQTYDQTRYMTDRVSQLQQLGYSQQQAQQVAQSEWGQGFAQSGNIAYGGPWNPFSSEKINQMAMNMPQQLGSAYGNLPPPAAQMINIAPGNLPGVRSF